MFIKVQYSQKLVLRGKTKHFLFFSFLSLKLFEIDQMNDTCIQITQCIFIDYESLKRSKVPVIKLNIFGLYLDLIQMETRLSNLTE